MKIYKPGSRGLHRVHVQPGREFPITDFVDADGNPKLITVAFKEGSAQVPDNLGQYMLDKGIARSSPILMLEDA